MTTENMPKNSIYLDHAATTPMDPRVLKKMTPYFRDKYGNASSLHQLGQRAREAIDEARETVAGVLKCKPSEVIFTGSGTESDNLAIKGVAENYAEKGKHLITTRFEHHAVLHPMEYLEKHRGFEVTYLPVDKHGLVDVKAIAKAIRKDTILVSVMYANNEIGTVEPVAEIGEVCRQADVLFHTDACQAAGSLPMEVKRLKVDLLTLNGSKIYGPKGVGVLYLREGAGVMPQMHGGGQEYRVRAGTENVAAIVGLAEALKLGQAEREKEGRRLTSLRDRLIREVLRTIPKSRVNGHLRKRLPNNAHFCFADIEGESILLRLDQEGIYGSSGSACTSGTLDPPHVLLAIGLTHGVAHGSLRLTLGHSTTAADIKVVVRKLAKVVKDLREISPF